MSRPSAGPDPLAEAPEQLVAPEQTHAPELRELLYLRQFFYQCPAGLFETDDAGIVQMVNPAAVRLLAPTIGGDDLSQLFPLLRRVGAWPFRAAGLAVPGSGPGRQLLCCRV